MDDEFDAYLLLGDYDICKYYIFYSFISVYDY